MTNFDTLEDAYLIHMSLSDETWLEVLQDLEDLDFGPDTMSLNIRCRGHLNREKKMLLINHLTYLC